MTEDETGAASVRARVTGWWNRTMFEPESTASLALIRIAFGVVALGWTLTLTPDVLDFFGAHAIAPPGSTTNGRWTVLQWASGDTAALVLYALLLVGSVALIVGFHARLAAFLVFVGMVSFSRRNPWVVNSGDLLLRHLAFYLILAPAGAALSFDAWRRHGSVWTFPRRAPWVRRLLQVQLSAIYLSTVVAKDGSTWHDGTAIGYALRIEDLVRFGLPHAVFDSLLLVNLLTFATLAVELSLGVLIWNKRARPWVLLAGVALHVSIDLALTVGFFSYGMLTLYLAFIEPDTSEGLLRRARARFARAGPAPVRT